MVNVSRADCFHHQGSMNCTFNLRLEILDPAGELTPIKAGRLVLFSSFHIFNNREQCMTIKITFTW